MMKYLTFGDRLKEARNKKGLTQEGIAKLLGISQQRYQPWEGGKLGKQIEPPHDMIIHLASLLDVSAEYLLFGKPDQIKESIAPYHTTIDKVKAILKDLDEQDRLDILKYAEEKKIISSIKRRRRLS